MSKQIQILISVVMKAVTEVMVKVGDTITAGSKYYQC